MNLETLKRRADELASASTAEIVRRLIGRLGRIHVKCAKAYIGRNLFSACQCDLCQAQVTYTVCRLLEHRARRIFDGPLGRMWPHHAWKHLAEAHAYSAASIRAREARRNIERELTWQPKKTLRSSSPE